jgi:hypothetical protein
MKTPLVIASLAALVLAASAAAVKPLVPVAAQRAIAKRTPRLAYVPARGTPPYRYRNWKLQHGVLRIWFANRNEPKKVVVFSVRAFGGDCRAGEQRGMQMAGVKVWYSQVGTLQEAWRCTHGLKIVTSTTLPPIRYSRFGLARIVASGHKIH